MNDASGQDAATRVINEHVRQRFPDLWKNYEMKLYDLRVVTRSPGSLRGDGRKLRRLVDKREMLERAPAPTGTSASHG